MKKISLTLMLFVAFSSSAQLGVYSISRRDSSPIGQWFSIRGKRYENEMSITESLLDSILEPWDLTIEDGEINEEGCLYWWLDNSNGYSAAVCLVESSYPGGSYIYVRNN